MIKGMRKNSNQRVYAFIDSQNLNVSTQKFGWKMDWRKFRKFLQDQYGVSQAYMFIGYVPEFEEMYEFLHAAGYNIVLKPTSDLTRPREIVAKPLPEDSAKEEKKPIKGNVDADLVLWVMKEGKNYDQAIIVSGDGDFYSLIEYLDQQGKLLKLLTPTGHYSSLFNKYERYVERLDHHRRQLAYRDKRRPKSQAH